MSLAFFPSPTPRRLLRAKRTDILSSSSVALLFLSPSHLPYPLPVFYLLALSVCQQHLTWARLVQTNEMSFFLTRVMWLRDEGLSMFMSSLTTRPVHDNGFVACQIISHRRMIVFDRQNRQRAVVDELMRTTIAMRSIFATPVDRAILDLVLNVTITTKD